MPPSIDSQRGRLFRWLRLPRGLRPWALSIRRTAGGLDACVTGSPATNTVLRRTFAEAFLNSGAEVFTSARQPAYHDGLPAASDAPPLDDRTWNDLDMHALFTVIDRAES